MEAGKFLSFDYDVGCPPEPFCLALRRESPAKTALGVGGGRSCEILERHLS
jgi:hypothetical protein